jgi:two-component system CheB/CheR fusion protein
MLDPDAARGDGQHASFIKLFHVEPSEETEHRAIFELGNGQWNIPQLRSLLHDLLPQNQQIDDFEVVHTFETIGRKRIWLNARKMTQGNGEDLILLAIEDHSDRSPASDLAP